MKNAISVSRKAFFKITGWTKGQFVLFTAIISIVGLMELVFIFGLAYISASGLMKNNSNNTQTVMLMLGLLLLIKILALLWQSYYITKKVFDVFEALFFRLAWRIVRLKIHDSNNAIENLKAKMGIDLNQIQINYIIPVITLLSEMVVSVILIAGLLINFFTETLILLGVLMPVGYIIGKTVSKLSHKAGKIRENSEVIRGRIVDYVMANRIPLSTRILGERFRQANLNSIHSLANAWRQQIFYGSLPRPIFELAGYTGMALIFIFNLEVNQSSISTIFVSFGAAGLRLLPSANRMALAIQHISYNHTTVSAIYKLLREEENIFNSNTKLNDEALPYKLNLQNININYGGKNLWEQDLNIQLVGNLIGIYGESGSGKSSLGHAIAGNINCEGNIEINGPLDDRGGEGSVRYVETSETLYGASILEEYNIYSGGKLDLRELQEMFADLGLVDLYVDVNNPELVSKLSNGQYQRLLFLRAWLENRSVYIFDEITSALDATSTVKLIEFVRKYNNNRLIIFITHSKEIIDQCDSILRVDPSGQK